MRSDLYLEGNILPMDCSSVKIRNYLPSDREVVYNISNISHLEGYDISELDILYNDWKEGQLVAEMDGRVIGFLSG